MLSWFRFDNCVVWCSAVQCRAVTIVRRSYICHSGGQFDNSNKCENLCQRHAQIQWQTLSWIVTRNYCMQFYKIIYFFFIVIFIFIYILLCIYLYLYSDLFVKTMEGNVNWHSHTIHHSVWCAVCLIRPALGSTWKTDGLVNVINSISIYIFIIFFRNVNNNKSLNWQIE